MAVQPATQGLGLGDVGEPLEPLVGSETQTEGRDNTDISEMDADQPLPLYGQFLFDQAVSTFAPTDDAPVPDEYRLGVGDQLVIQLFGKENDTYTLLVGRDGNITFPRLGTITVLGLTFEDARALVNTRIEQQLIGVEVAITMGRLRAIGVFMAGEIRVPGAYSVSALTTVTQALYQAGGLSDIGSLRGIQVRRKGNIVSTFDAYDLLMFGDSSKDIRLQSGDVLFVPTVKSVVEIRGQVRRPMSYELLGSESVSDLIKMAGGLTGKAFVDLATLTRSSNEGGLPFVESLNLTESSVRSLKLRDGDRLLVPAVGNRLENNIAVSYTHLTLPTKA